MSTKGIAHWEQAFSVEKGALLECNPEWLMLQEESSFRQSTQIEVAAGGELFFIEAIAPGRVAHGEAFAFRDFYNRLSLHYDNRLVALEKHHLCPGNETHKAWSAGGAKRFYVSIFLVSERLSEQAGFFERIHSQQTDDLSIGISQLRSGPCWTIKALSEDPALLRRKIEGIRSQFYESIGRPTPKLRRQ